MGAYELHEHPLWRLHGLYVDLFVPLLWQRCLAFYFGGHLSVANYYAQSAKRKLRVKCHTAIMVEH